MAESKTTGVTNYRNLVIPLTRINRRYSDIMRLLPVDGEPTVVAARAVFETLFGLFHASNGNEWLLARERICIGLVKDTKDFGNTSVSQGCAVEYFTKHPNESIVAFLNCGTGGIKYQVYERKPNGVITPKGEYKPKDGASPQEFLKDDGGVADAMRMAWHREKLKSEMAEASIPDGCAVFAFVTGKIRAAWESGADFSKASFEKVVAEFFSVDARVSQYTPGSFFLTQDREGALELLGTDSMYENLTMAGELPKSVRTIATFGIGRGSAQLTWESVDRAQQKPMNTTPGMDDELGLSTLPRRIMPELRANTGAIMEYMGDYDRPTIALKSGCMLYLNSKDGKPLLDLLTTAPKPKPEVDAHRVAVLKFVTSTLFGAISQLPSLANEKERPEVTECGQMEIQRLLGNFGGGVVFHG